LVGAAVGDAAESMAKALVACGLAGLFANEADGCTAGISIDCLGGLLFVRLKADKFY